MRRRISEDSVLISHCRVNLTTLIEFINSVWEGALYP
jgi:hypothetical protein